MRASSLSQRMPDAFVILFFVIVLATACTYLVPAGAFSTHQVIDPISGESSTLVQPGSFAFDAAHEAGIPLFADSEQGKGMFNYAFEGLVSGNKWGSAVGVIAFILIVGGAFGIVMKTGAINNGILALIQRTQHTDKVVLPLLFVMFSLGGAIFGMGEEAIAFCIVLVPLVIALGYDSITAILLTYVATQIGFATSWMNPFSVAIAQGIAGLPLLSGQGFRMVIWVIFTLTGLAFTWHYAQRVKQAPERSRNWHNDRHMAPDDKTVSVSFKRTDGFIIVLFFAVIGWVIWGVTAKGYYIPQIATQFFVMGILAGAIACWSGRMRMNDVSQAFVSGAQDLLPAALIVGMAKGIVLILGGDDVTTPSVLNTLLYYTSAGLAETSSVISAILMLLFQSVFNFFVASGSGQAAITMPLMSPLSDLVGVSRQTAVLAFQLGDGLTNLVIPTSASLIGCLGVAKLDWSVWIQVIWKFALLLFALANLTIVAAVLTGL